MVSRLPESFSPRRTHEPSLSVSEFDDLAADSELLAIFVETRNPAAAEKLIRRHSPLVAGLVRRMLQNANDAEDAFQATFLILLKSASKIRNQGSLSAWLYGVAYRTACRIRRQSKERRMVAIDEPKNIASENEVDPLEKIATESQLELLDRELQKLQPSLRDILIEHHLLGMSVPQIADRFELSNSAVEGRLRRGRAALRQKLARRGISFSVAVAVAAAYQSRSIAAYAEPWQQSFLLSELFSQTVSTGTPPAESPLQSLIQGEPAMSSVLTTKWVSMVAASVVLAAGLGALQFASTGDGQSSGPSLFVAEASAETGTSTVPVVIAQNTPTANDAGTRTLTLSGKGETTTGTLEFNGSNGSATIKSAPANGGVLNLGASNAGAGTLVLTGNVSGAAKPPASESKGGPNQAPRIVPFKKPDGPLPNWMTSGGTIAEEENKARESLRRDLRKLVKPDFTNAPLRAVIEQLSQETSIPFLIDTVAMEGGTATPEDPITLTGLREMSLQRALKTILDPLELTYVIEPDYIVITTKENGKSRTLRTYDLAFLLPSNEKSQELVSLIQTIVPSNWDMDGGADTLQVFGSMIIASCPEETHLAIEGVLFELSKMTKENIDVPSYPIDPNTLPPGMGGMGGGGMGGGGMH